MFSATHKRKSTINKKNISAHTRRFRALYSDPSLGPIKFLGHSPVIKVRSLASVGGQTRKGYKKRGNRGYMPINYDTALLPNIAKGIQAMRDVSKETLTRLLPQSKRQLRAVKEK